MSLFEDGRRPLISHCVKWWAPQKRCFVHVSVAHGEGSGSTHDLSTRDCCHSFKLNITSAIFFHMSFRCCCVTQSLVKFLTESHFLFLSAGIQYNLELHGLLQQSAPKTLKWCHQHARWQSALWHLQFRYIIILTSCSICLSLNPSGRTRWWKNWITPKSSSVPWSYSVPRNWDFSPLGTPSYQRIPPCIHFLSSCSIKQPQDNHIIRH